MKYTAKYIQIKVGTEQRELVYEDENGNQIVGSDEECGLLLRKGEQLFDANGKEIMSGFTEEFAEHDIEIWWNNVNPSITERITGVNKAFRFGQLKVFASANTDKLQMCLQTRDFDDTGKPRKGKGPNALDHWGE